MDNQDFVGGLSAVKQLMEQSNIAAASFSETVFTAMTIADEDLDGFRERLVLELAAAPTPEFDDDLEGADWVFVARRIAVSLEVTQALFERALADHEAAKCTS
jgi:hypothetical protein